MDFAVGFAGARGRAASTIVLGISAPVGQACTHSPQATQVEAPIGSSKSKTIFSCGPRHAMPITSLTCTSRQARTHRLQWMQASRLTAIAGWDRSGAGAGVPGKARHLDVHRLGPVPERSRCGHGRRRLAAGRRPAAPSPCARAARARSLAVYTFMPARRLADAGGRKHPLALHLDHAGPAVAVGAVAGRVLPAQVRDGGAEPLGHLPDGLARTRLRPPCRRAVN